MSHKKGQYKKIKKKLKKFKKSIDFVIYVWYINEATCEKKQLQMIFEN